MLRCRRLWGPVFGCLRKEPHVTVFGPPDWSRRYRCPGERAGWPTSDRFGETGRLVPNEHQSRSQTNRENPVATLIQCCLGPNRQAYKSPNTAPMGSLSGLLAEAGEAVPAARMVEAPRSVVEELLDLLGQTCVRNVCETSQTAPNCPQPTTIGGPANPHRKPLSATQVTQPELQKAPS